MSLTHSVVRLYIHFHTIWGVLSSSWNAFCLINVSTHCLTFGSFRFEASTSHVMNCSFPRDSRSLGVTKAELEAEGCCRCDPGIFPVICPVAGEIRHGRTIVQGWSTLPHNEYSGSCKVKRHCLMTYCEPRMGQNLVGTGSLTSL